MMIHTHIKVVFNDWLYFILYDVEPLDLAVHAANKLSVLFDEGRKARFRFENGSLYAEEALVDENYQYGKYHLSKINFSEDFFELSPESLGSNMVRFVKDNVSKIIPVEEIEKAVSTIQQTLDVFIKPSHQCFELKDHEDMPESKKAPFGISDDFKAYLLFEQGHSNRFIYIELAVC